MKTIFSHDFDEYQKQNPVNKEDGAAVQVVKEVIEKVRAEGDKAVRYYASKWDRSSPETFEVPLSVVRNALGELAASDLELVKALRLATENIRRFSMEQRGQFRDFEFENGSGVFTGQKVIAVERAGVYVPGGRFPLISSALMCLIPAFCAGAEQVCFASPPTENGIPDKSILAAAGIAAEICGRLDKGFRVFAMGGAQAIAALGLGTETVPRCDVIAGPGNKYVAAAKRILFGEAGIDLIAGPSDILVIMDKDADCDLAAVDMLAQAEHDPDARARVLVPDKAMADKLLQAVKTQLEKYFMAHNDSESSVIPQASLDAGGLIIIYKDREDAVHIANAIAPEHLELMACDPQSWTAGLKNYGSLFIGSSSAEVLGDYSSGLNHTLPTLGSARFTGGLSVRHFLKTQTTLRCEKAAGYTAALEAAQTIARAEGLAFHAESARARMGK